MLLPPPLHPIARRLRGAAVLTDFDGALAPIVADPSAARAMPGAAAALQRLARGGARVAVVTGRESSFVAGLGVPVVGQYGLEDRPRPPRLDEAAATLARLGLPIERKSHMLTVHTRAAPERWDELRRAADEVAAATGLVALPAKLAVEIRPSREGKGEVVARLARGVPAALYAGDDWGDLPGFRALRRLGVPTAAVVVMGRETPADLVREADIACPGPSEWVAWLTALARCSNASQGSVVTSRR